MLRSLLADVAAKDEQIRAKDVLIERHAREAAFKQALIDKLMHEMAVLKRLKFAAASEKFRAGMSAEQKSLLDETLVADIAELACDITQLDLGQKAQELQDKEQPKQQALASNLPRREAHHEPASTLCGCGCQMKRIGQDVAEKLDYQPGISTVERHVRGKRVCAKCENLVQAPVPRTSSTRNCRPPGCSRACRRQVPGLSAGLPAGAHLRARGTGRRAFHAGALVRRTRRIVAVACAGPRHRRRPVPQGVRRQPDREPKRLDCPLHAQVKRQGDGSPTRWSDTKDRFSKLRGYRDMKQLAAALDRHVPANQPEQLRTI
jgi:hypothetical protein